MGVAYRWLRDAGEDVVYLIPDGPTDVTKSERTGCYPDVFARVLAYKEAHVRKDADTLNGCLAGPRRNKSLTTTRTTDARHPTRIG